MLENSITVERKYGRTMLIDSRVPSVSFKSTLDLLCQLALPWKPNSAAWSVQTQMNVPLFLWFSSWRENRQIQLMCRPLEALWGFSSTRIVWDYNPQGRPRSHEDMISGWTRWLAEDFT